MQDAKAELNPFISDLTDMETLFDGELSKSTVNSAKDLIKKANWHGSDVNDSLTDVERELDRVSAEFAKYE
jgi:hypothetical protein